jgi:DNA segregation ATPase FtsK/SpoIIIE-like protein
MQADDHPQFADKILAGRTLVAKFEIMLYALPDDFVVYVDSSGQSLGKNHFTVTRSRRAYESSDNARRRYVQLISPSEMYDIIKRHLEYEKGRLKSLEDSSDESVHVKDKKLRQLTVTLEELRKASGTTLLLELQPRWSRRSDDENELYEEAVSLVARTRVADVTLIRDNLTIGHALAAKLMKRLEDEGLVSVLSEGALRRTVLITVEDMQNREAVKHADK